VSAADATYPEFITCSELPLEACRACRVISGCGGARSVEGRQRGHSPEADSRPRNMHGVMPGHLTGGT
jgi:hypothetical protein